MFDDYFVSLAESTGLPWLKFADQAVTILIILIGSFIIIRLSKVAGKRIYRFVEDKDTENVSEREQRAATLISVVRHTITVATLAVAIMLILQSIGLDITPLIASAGVIGLAIGFGAQSLVKDVISGFFILLEDLYGEGDTVEIGGKYGIVEAVNIRGTTLRGPDGAVHYIPNGEVVTSTNMTKGWSRADITIGISYDENVDNVIDILENLCEEFYNDEKYNSLIIEPPAMLGVQNLGDFSVDIRLTIKTLPGMQWSIAREFNRRVKNRFEDDNIEIPYPHMVTLKKVGVSE